jgi:hypothetical protein
LLKNNAVTEIAGHRSTLALGLHCFRHSFVPNEVEVRMKFKLMAAILGMGLMIASPGVVFAQYADDQVPDQDSKPSPNIQAPTQAPMPGPNDQGSMEQGSDDQGSMSQGSNDQGPNDQGSMDQGPTGGPNDAGPGNPTSNAPAPAETRGVARISLIHGDVSTQRGDSKDWSAAVLNAPVLAGDRVSTGDKARTELQLDYANMFRLAEHTQANITQLTRSQIQIQTWTRHGELLRVQEQRC